MITSAGMHSIMEYSISPQSRLNHAATVAALRARSSVTVRVVAALHALPRVVAAAATPTQHDVRPDRT